MPTHIDQRAAAAGRGFVELLAFGRQCAAHRQHDGAVLHFRPHRSDAAPGERRPAFIGADFRLTAGEDHRAVDKRFGAAVAGLDDLLQLEIAGAELVVQVDQAERDLSCVDFADIVEAVYEERSRPR